MKIGLYDLNKAAFNKVRYEFPDIDLMKVYSYYKKNDKNIVELSLDYHDYKNYDLYYCFNNSRHKIGKQLLDLQYKENVTLIGICFFGDIWFPMDNEIEHCEPDINIYSTYLRQKIINEEAMPGFERLINDNYYLRYFYPDWHWKIIPNKIKDKRVIFYDFDFTSNEGWQDIFLKVRQDSGRHCAFRHKIQLNTIEDLQFAAKHKMHLSGTKYPPKFVLNMPELREDFPSFFKEYEQELRVFPVRSLYIYSNHSNKNEIEQLAEAVDICMYALARKVQIYTLFDYSMFRKKYDIFLRRTDFYFLGGCKVPLADELRYGGDTSELLLEMKEKTPLFYEKVKNINRDDVKQNKKEWVYGER